MLDLKTPSRPRAMRLFAPWAKPMPLAMQLRNWIFAMVRPSVTTKTPAPIEKIRLEMLLLLDQAGARAWPTLEHRLLFAQNVDTLWHARPVLMLAVSLSLGEIAARQRLDEISALFQGYGGGLQTRGEEPQLP